MWSPYMELSNRHPKKVTKGQGQNMKNAKKNQIYTLNCFW